MAHHFENVLNFRDLGGLPAAGGRKVRAGLLLRSAHLGDASPSDIRILQEVFHLRKIFDFRTIPEAEARPDAQIPGAEHILLPTLDQEAERKSGEAVPARTWLELPSHIARLSFTPLFQKKARDLYPSLVLSEYSQLQYATFMHVVAETGDGAVLWHCSQGKDRTGMGAALLLAALGATRETIMEDFDRSNIPYAPLVNELCAQVERMGGGEEEKDVVRAFMGVSTRNFSRALDIIDSRWGSMKNYMADQMGFSQADCDLMEKRYLE